MKRWLILFLLAAGSAFAGTNLFGNGVSGTPVGTALRCARFGADGRLTAASGDCSSGDTGGGGGEVNTGVNIGGGANIFKQKSGVDLQLRTLGSHFAVNGDLVELDPNSADQLFPGNVSRMMTPSIPSNTAGIAQAIAACSGNADCVVKLGKGDFNITKACSAWLRGNGAGGTAAGDKDNGGGAIPLVAGEQNIVIEGLGPTATRINWASAFTLAGCGTASQGVGRASIFRIEGPSAGNATANITFRNLKMEIAQTSLAGAANQLVGMAAVDIGIAGLENHIRFENVYIEAKQDDIAPHGARDAYGIRVEAGCPSQACVPDASQITVRDSVIETSGPGIYIDSAEDFSISDSWIGTVDEAGFGCSDRLVYKKDGGFKSHGNTWDIRHSDPATCTAVSGPIMRWAQLDGRRSSGGGNTVDFPGAGAQFDGDVFRINDTTSPYIVEGFYITGYNALSITNSLFLCSSDDLEGNTAGDNRRDHCLMNLFQIDDTMIGSAFTPCSANTPCNLGGIFANNRIVNFQDNTNAWTDDTHKCPIDINTPANTDLADNQYWDIHDNVCHLVDATGATDTGPLADCFCGDANGTAYVGKNFIHNNVVVGKPTMCLAGFNVGGVCNLEDNISDKGLRVKNFIPPQYTVATLPSVGSTADGVVAQITDGANARTCTSGGGSTITSCIRRNGTWEVNAPEFEALRGLSFASKTVGQVLGWDGVNWHNADPGVICSGFYCYPLVGDTSGLSLGVTTPGLPALANAQYYANGTFDLNRNQNVPGGNGWRLQGNSVADLFTVDPINARVGIGVANGSQTASLHLGPARTMRVESLASCFTQPGGGLLSTDVNGVLTCFPRTLVTTGLIGSNTWGAGATQTWIWDTGADPDPRVDFGDTGVVWNSTNLDIDWQVKSQHDAGMVLDANTDTWGLGGVIASVRAAIIGIANQVTLVVKMFAGQTNDAQQWQDSTGANVAAISATGNLTLAGAVRGKVDVYTKTNSGSPHTITATECSGGIITNNGAAGAAIYNLPAATVGLYCTFQVIANQAITINPNGNERIQVLTNGSSGTGDAIQSDTVTGTQITIYSYAAGNWAPLGQAGTWTDIN